MLDVNNHEAFQTKAEVLNTLNIRRANGEPYQQYQPGRLPLPGLEETSIWFINQLAARSIWTNHIEDERIIETTTKGTPPIEKRPQAAINWRHDLERANAGVDVVRVAFVYDHDPDNDWQKAWRFQGVYRLRPAAANPLPRQLEWELISTQFEYQA